MCLWLWYDDVQGLQERQQINDNDTTKNMETVYDGEIFKLLSEFVKKNSQTYLVNGIARGMFTLKHVCVCVCVCAWPRAYRPKCTRYIISFTKFLCMLPIAVARSSYGSKTKSRREWAIWGFSSPLTMHCTA